MLRNLSIFGLFLSSLVIFIAAFPTPQDSQKNQKESPDFKFGGEKALRSLDQVTYPDGQNRGRSILKDSYGNPINNYDSLDDIDAGRPGRNSENPHQYVIPGYASGILDPNELPTRSAFLPETGRRVSDDRVHFIDPLTNSFQNNPQQQPPLPGLLPPSSNNNERAISNYPIDIPKPNIDLPATPQVEVNDPLNQPLFPPADEASSSGVGQPSIDLQLPNFNTNTQQGLLPPPASIDIPRPNLNADETPIDYSNGPINQGLIPPNPNFSKASERADIGSTNQDETVFIPEGKVIFAPKPSNGLLPPKDPSVDINLNFDYNQNVDPSTTTVPSRGVNKFTGSFGAPSGVLGGRPSLTANRDDSNHNNQNPFGPITTPIPALSINNQIPFNRPSTGNKFNRPNFGGPAGVLTPIGQAPPVAQVTETPFNPTTATVSNNKFNGVSSFDNQLPSRGTFNDVGKESVANKFTGSFGGPAGVLKPFDRT